MCLNILALQRQSHVAEGVASLSVSARITEVLEYIKHTSSEIDFVSLPEGDQLLSGACSWVDCIVLSKHSSLEAIEITEKLKRRGAQVIYDIDDWIFSFPSYSGGKSQSEKIAQIQYLIELADCVTVANANLYERLRGKYQNISLVPNGMWVEKYNAMPSFSCSEREDRRPKIVFTNADFIKMQTAKDLLFTSLQMFFTKNSDFVLDFYGDPFPEIPSLPFLHYTNRMQYDKYMKSLVNGKYRLSISPLGADEDAEAIAFNECKNPFKYLNYGSAGVPGIYSKSSIYTDCISDGDNGLLVDNSCESWLEALYKLSFDSPLRNRIRKNAYEDVMNRHHIKYSAKALMEILR